jgi:hypothetical protein
LAANCSADRAFGGAFAPSKTAPFQTTRNNPSDFFERSDVLPVADGCDLKTVENNMQNDIEAAKQNALSSICLIPAEELAWATGHKDAKNKFKAWCQQTGIKPVPGNEKFFDPKLVRLRLDEIQGIAASVANDAAPSLVEQRRARLAAG